MKKRTLAILLAACMLIGLFAACGTEPAPAEEASAPVEVAAEEPAPETPAEEAPAEAPAEESAEEPAEEPAEASAEEAPVEEPAPESSAEEAPVEEPAEAPAEGATCTVTFSDGQTFEATVGEDFVFFFQCDAPGDMGEPVAGEEGAGITVSEGTVTYDHVGLGGPFKYPTSELVIISGFTGDITITITDAATVMGATYTIYTDPAEIEEAIAFADMMAAQQAANPMPGEGGAPGEGAPDAPPDAPPAS